MNFKEYRERVAKLDIPEPVRAAVNTIIDHAEAAGKQIVDDDHISNLILVAEDEDTATQLVLDLAIC